MIATKGAPDSRFKAYFVYALSDPDTKQIRYIGRTGNPQARFTALNVGSRTKLETPVHNWLARLKKDGKQPIVEFLCTLTGPIALDLSKQAERGAIRWLSHRYDLLNVQHNAKRQRDRARRWRLREITYRGETQCCAAWVRELGISRERLRQRLDAYPLERAMNPPSRKKAVA